MTTAKLPAIRIKNAWLLRQNASEHLNELWGDGTPLRTHEEYEVITERYRKAWQPFERKILVGLSDVLGLEFRQPEIDVYIAPWFAAFSDPMVIGVIYDDERFIQTLTHELAHRLLTDNRLYHNTKNLPDVWRKLFGETPDDTVLFHIPVHAVLEAVFVDILKKPEWLDRDVQVSQEWDGYREAWAYVKKENYHKIIEKLKGSYKDIR